MTNGPVYEIPISDGQPVPPRLTTPVVDPVTAPANDHPANSWPLLPATDVPPPAGPVFPPPGAFAAAPPPVVTPPVSASHAAAPPMAAPHVAAPQMAAPTMAPPMAPPTLVPTAAPVPAGSQAPNFPPPFPPSPAPTLAPTGIVAQVANPPAAEPEVERVPRVFTHPDSDADLLAALDYVVYMGGSDLHVTRDAVPTIRLHGSLQSVPGAVVWDFDKLQAALHSIMSDRHREMFESELELDFAFTLSDDARFRVNIYQQRGSMGAAFRLIPSEIKQLSELGVPDTIGRFARLPRGLVLVTGPTGSGKSTTLAAVIDLVNRERADHIVTVEDPIEFMHSNKKSLVNQREVGGDTHSFNSALKHVLRQDPDVILIGELRDLETISVALTAAETGHLVFATLHTQSAASTIDRVIDVFPPHQQGQVRAQLASTLQGVVCQTLVKHASGVGRVVATEVMVATPALGNLIREGKTYQIPSAMQAGRELGMHTMDQHLAELVNSGAITHAAAMEKAQDREDLLQLIRREEASGRFAARSMDMGA